MAACAASTTAGSTTAAGRCLEQPGEPDGQHLPRADSPPRLSLPRAGGHHLRLHGAGRAAAASPTTSSSWPPRPARFATKYCAECNYLQGNEGNFDPQHLSFLHRFFKPREGDFRNDIHAKDPTPQIEPVDTDFGMHLYAIRDVEGGGKFVKVRSFFMPGAGAIGSRGEEGYGVNWHVPIDDEHHWRYSIFFQRTQPLDPEETRRARASVAENYRLVRSKANRFLQDREEMKTQTFIGMGRDFVVHDSWATESEGPIYDRKREHLGYTTGASSTCARSCSRRSKTSRRAASRAAWCATPHRTTGPT